MLFCIVWTTTLKRHISSTTVNKIYLPVEEVPAVVGVVSEICLKKEITQLLNKNLIKISNHINLRRSHNVFPLILN